MADNVLTKEETRKALMAVMAAAMRGDPSPPDLYANKKYMRAEDIDAVMDEINNLMAKHFDQIPEEVSGELKAQETIRYHIDQIMADHVLAARQGVEKLKRK